jgi:acyl-CoA synthetase (NDP forming)
VPADRGDTIRNFLSPSSVAIVGASADETTLSGRLLYLLRQHGFAGKIYPVNPRHQTISGIQCYPSIADVPEAVDLALIAVPSASVADVVRQCGERNIPGAYVISAGFNEAPEGTTGAAAAQGLIAAARGGPTRVSGPNAEGIYNVIDDIALGFSPVLDYDHVLKSRPRPGNVAVIAQSGGLGFGIFNLGLARGIDFSHIITTGNEVDLDATDYLEFLVNDDDTDVVVLFIEGLERPSRLRELGLRAAECGKTIVVVKVGRSAEAQRAAVSHTGHVTGPGHLWSALLRSAGIVEVTDMADLLDVVAALSAWPSGGGSRVGIVGGSGGAGVWMTDVLRANGMEVPEIEEELQQEMRSFLPYYASPVNPVDFTAGIRQRSDMDRVLSLVGKSERLDVIVVVASLMHAPTPAETAALYRGIGEQTGKPVLTYSYTSPAQEAIAAFAAARVPIYLSQTGVARAVSALADRAVGIAAPPRELADSELADSELADSELADSELADRAAPPASLPVPDGETLHEAAVKEWLARCGFRLPAGHLAASAADAVSAAEAIGYPVALKAQSARLPHKAAAGVLALNLTCAAQVRGAYQAIHDRAVSAAGAGQVAGVLVEKMADPGFEMLVGISRDPSLGPFLTIGAGGTDTELLADVATLAAPATADQVRAALSGLRCGKVFDPRSSRALDTTAFCALAARISDIAARSPGLKELDLNPVIVHRAGHGTDIVDGLAVVSPALPGHGGRRYTD